MRAIQNRANRFSGTRAFSGLQGRILNAGDRRFKMMVTLSRPPLSMLTDRPRKYPGDF